MESKFKDLATRDGLRGPECINLAEHGEKNLSVGLLMLARLIL